MVVARDKIPNLAIDDWELKTLHDSDKFSSAINRSSFIPLVILWCHIAIFTPFHHGRVQHVSRRVQPKAGIMVWMLYST